MAQQRQDGGIGLSVEESGRYRSFRDLHPLHWEKIKARDPAQVKAACGCEYLDGRYTLQMLGRPITVDPDGQTVLYPDAPSKEAGYQRALVAVSFLGGAIDVPPSGRLVSPREFPGGAGFFRGPHELPTPVIARAFETDPEALYAAGAKLGASRAKGGDAAIEFEALPGIGAGVLVWAGDDELPGSAALLLEARTHLHLALDVVWALSNVMARELTREQLAA